MPKIKLGKLTAKSFSRLAKSKNEIAIIAGIVGFGAAMFIIGKETPKAMILLEEAKKNSSTGKLPVKKTAGILAKSYAAPFGLAVSSLSLATGGLISNCKKIKTLEGLAESANEAYKKYKAKVIETVGDEKEKEVHKTLSKERFDNFDSYDYGIDPDTVYIFEDSFSGQRVKTTAHEINQCALLLNREMLTEMFIPMNDFYEAIGMNFTKSGEKFGFNIDDGFIAPKYSRHYMDERGRFIIIIDYENEPSVDYFK